MNTPNCIVLFSGGLDSLLSAKIMQEHGINCKCIHFVSPFFGSASKIEEWQNKYALDIEARDIGQEFVDMLSNGPEHGFGKHLNPCIDCKIFLFAMAKEIMRQMGAKFLVSGEVIGQRPMSQRKDILNHIQNKAGVKDLVVRPLCGKHLMETLPEKEGLIKRRWLHEINGRGRQGQYQLAEYFKLDDIPAPAGGCLLTEKENSIRYWQILKMAKINNIHLTPADFLLIKYGRQYFAETDNCRWLIVGRNAKDNELLLNSATKDDLTIKLADLPGPIAVARGGVNWSLTSLQEAASICAAHSPKALKAQKEIKANFRGKGKSFSLYIYPKLFPDKWNVPDWEEVKKEIRGFSHNG